ncbi:MAG: endo-1,4-beta-xylanase [Armatimonadota bacterium]
MTQQSLRQLADQCGILIGAACSPNSIEQEPAYRETLAQEFNCIVAENCMKFSYLQPERGQFDFTAADALVNFAQQHYIKLRGHTLVWHNQLPEWFKEGEFSKTEALDILQAHIFTVLDHFKGAAFCWDVVNEALADEGGWREKSPWFRMIGPEYLNYAFRWAHEADPDIQLFYNDYGMEMSEEKAGACYRMLSEMQRAGVPLHGVGFQYHLGAENHLDHDSLLTNFQRFSDLGLEIHLTELDMGIKKPITDELRQAQADEYANRIRIALDCAAVSAIMFWGFTDRYSWIPGFTKGEFDEPLLFDAEYRPKLAYEAVRSELARQVAVQ